MFVISEAAGEDGDEDDDNILKAYDENGDILLQLLSIKIGGRVWCVHHHLDMAEIWVLIWGAMVGAQGEERERRRWREMGRDGEDDEVASL